MKLKTIKSIVAAALCAPVWALTCCGYFVDDNIEVDVINKQITISPRNASKPAAMIDFDTINDVPWSGSLSGTATSIWVKAGVTRIGKNAFQDTKKTAMKVLRVASIESWCNVELSDKTSAPFNKAGSGDAITRELKVDDQLVQDLIIPKTVTNIGQYQFYYCDSFTNLTISSGVTNIAAYAFYQCRGLSNVTCKAVHPPTLASSSISPAIIQCIYVPKNSLEEYKKAPWWKNYKDKIQAIPAEPTGDNAYVEVGADGSCLIFGEGSVTNFPSGFDRESITSAEIEGGITEIGARFFKNCTKMKTVTLGKDVKTFGEKAFYKCYSLETINVASADSLDALTAVVNYHMMYDADGNFVMAPKINIAGYVEMLYGKKNLAQAEWDPIGKLSEQNLEELKAADEYHFFQTRLVAEQ